LRDVVAEASQWFVRRSLLPLLVFGLALLGSSFADEAFKIIHVEDLSKLMSDQPKTLAIYDANPASTREREGIIPGAHLLSSSAYDVAKELPAAKDTKLVFYCANTH
jgi:hypothetical protein